MTTTTPLRTALGATLVLALSATPVLAQQSENNLPLQNAPPSKRIVGQGASAAEAGGDTPLGQKLGLRSEPHRTHHATRHHGTHAASSSMAAPSATTPAPMAPATTAPSTTAPATTAPAPMAPAAPATTAPSVPPATSNPPPQS